MSSRRGTDVLAGMGHRPAQVAELLPEVHDARAEVDDVGVEGGDFRGEGDNRRAEMEGLLSEVESPPIGGSSIGILSR